MRETLQKVLQQNSKIFCENANYKYNIWDSRENIYDKCVPSSLDRPTLKVEKSTCRPSSKSQLGQLKNKLDFLDKFRISKTLPSPPPPSRENHRSAPARGTSNV